MINKELKIISEFSSNEDIYSNFDSLKDKLTKSKNKLWHEYFESFTREASTLEDKVYLFSTVDARYFFNEENLTSNYIKWIKLLKAVPGILTGLGILGTFLGLTLGLNHVELGTADVNTLKQGIISLLSGISTAFLTSLFGIFFSIFFLFVLNFELDSLNKRINEIAEKLNSLFPVKTSEEILFQVLQESRSQTKELKNFNATFAAELSKTIEESLKPTFSELIKAIRDLTEIGASEVAKTIVEGAGDKIVELRDVLEEVGKVLRSSAEQARETQEKLAESFDDFIDRFSVSLENLEISLSQVTTIVENTKETARFFNDVLGQMNEVSFDLSNTTESLKNIHEHIQKSQEILKAHVNTIKETITSFEQASESVKNAWMAYEERFNGIKEDLEDIFTELSRQLQEYSKLTGEDLGGKLEKFDKFLSIAVEGLRGFVEEVKDLQLECLDQLNNLSQKGEAPLDINE